jgi:hypothetical protein
MVTHWSLKVSKFDKLTESILTEAKLGQVQDSKLAMSLASLIKKNDGKFQSDKQAKYIVSRGKKGDEVTSKLYKEIAADTGASAVIISPMSFFKGKQYKQVYFINDEGVLAWYSARGDDYKQDFSDELYDAKRDMRGGGLSYEEYMDIVHRAKNAPTRTTWRHTKKWEKK